MWEHVYAELLFRNVISVKQNYLRSVTHSHHQVVNNFQEEQGVSTVSIPFGTDKVSAAVTRPLCIVVKEEERTGLWKKKTIFIGWLPCYECLLLVEKFDCKCQQIRSLLESAEWLISRGSAVM